MGIDKSKEDHMLDVTFQIENPQVGSSSLAMAQNEPPSDILTITATDILSAKELANSSVSRKLDLSQVETIIIGEAFAKSDYFHNVIASSLRDPEIRRKMIMIVSKEKAREFIDNNHAKLETRPHKYYSFMRNRWKDTGYVPISDLNRYLQRTSGALFLAIYATSERDEERRKNPDNYVAGQVPQKEGDPVQMIGSAVFKDGKMIGTLTGEETRSALLIRKKSMAHHYIDSIKDPKKEDLMISARVLKEEQARFRIDLTKDHPELYITVPLRVQILSTPSGIDYASNEKNQALLKRDIKKDLEEKTSKLIKKTKEEYHAEPFVWYEEVRRKFLTMEDFIKYDWQNKYRDAQIHLDFEITIESFGSTLKPQKIKPKE
ncbi:Ger(x)C family spore germination C-terminal domain-containing protein [Sporosarcina thermotolerans]|uniref:Ger(x)C family spore germination protein n=1 Tax=Sporosarcina thermotolerans TaxID=633404 RepID=UPI0024BCDA60|nr:Ger(x)C family spore germination C-terminal domain-containing protein [Sporosarcina thermotolerans]WHT49175.1 Ger(x)C family spore germination C-terminal domain-containing protein [Sporosarcina thermotolerans]